MRPDFSPISFNSYNLAQAFNMMSPKEVFTARVIAWALPPNPMIVNIGAGTGTTGLAFAESRKDATIFTVDISRGSPFGGLRNEINAFEGTGYPLPGHLLGDSKIIGQEWDRGMIDLLSIDADHSWTGCIGDFNAWHKHVKIGGYILFHDYDRDEWPDVKVVVDDLVSSGIIEKVFLNDTMFVSRYIGDKVEDSGRPKRQVRGNSKQSSKSDKSKDTPGDPEQDTK